MSKETAKNFLLGVNMSRLDALRESSNPEGILHFFISHWPWLPRYSVGDTSEDDCYMKYIYRRKWTRRREVDCSR